MVVEPNQKPSFLNTERKKPKRMFDDQLQKKTGLISPVV